MTNAAYVQAVKACPRVSWIENSMDLYTKKWSPSRYFGHAVGTDKDGRIRVVRDDELADPISVQNLAFRSTKNHLLSVSRIAFDNLES